MKHFRARWSATSLVLTTSTGQLAALNEADGAPNGQLTLICLRSLRGESVGNGFCAAVVGGDNVVSAVLMEQGQMIASSVFPRRPVLPKLTV